MKKNFLILLIFCLPVLIYPNAVRADQYDNSIQRGVRWLARQQNPDGSWGSSEAVMPMDTTEAVIALHALNQAIPEYYSGITWIENHNYSNLDYDSRKIRALSPHGDDVSGDIEFITGSIQSGLLATDQNLSGWGLTSIYGKCPFDSAFGLDGLADTGWADFTDTISYLIQSQNSDGSWSIGDDTSGDPYTTSMVLLALLDYSGQAGTTIDGAVQKAITYLQSSVTDTSAPSIRAISALALLRQLVDPSTGIALLSILNSEQSTDGSWNDDVYLSCLVLRAMACTMGTGSGNPDSPCSIPDAALRQAINYSTDKNAMDALTTGEMKQITSLTAAGMGISNLTGLEQATNLTYLDLRNNRITDLSPLTILPNLQTVLLSGNNLSNTADADGDGYPDSVDAYPLDPMRHLSLEPGFEQTVPSPGASGDGFGASVSVSGDYAIIGAPYDSGMGTASGKAYIFRKNGTTWTLETGLTGNDLGYGSLFGSSVAVSGDFAIVGAPGDGQNGTGAGAAYIFQQTNGVWSQVAKVTAYDGESNEAFGTSVSISGDYAVAGVNTNYTNGQQASAGAAYVFEYSNGAWLNYVKITPDVPSGNYDNFGRSVSIDGSNLIAGASGADNANGLRTGAAYVFELQNGVWTQTQKITADDGQPGDAFGAAVSTSSGLAVIGATGADDSGTDAGAAYVFTEDNNIWTRTGKLLPKSATAGGGFGASVSVNGTYAVVGDDEGSGSSGVQSGTTYVFSLLDATSIDLLHTTSIQWFEIDPDNGKTGDRFGHSVSVFGNELITGADAAGTAYLYELPSKTGSKLSI